MYDKRDALRKKSVQIMFFLECWIKLVIFLDLPASL